MGYNIAFSGLTATAEAIDVTSNNIANAQTVGYKAGEYLFSDEFFRAQDPQSRDRSGMGTYRMAIRREMNYGTVTTTQNALDVALTGPGMFVLAKNATNTVPTQTPDTFQYTRNGQFGVDSNNNIVNENGMYVVGYPANVDGQSINKSQFSILSLDQTPMPAKQTTSSTIAMNLDNRGNPIQASFNPAQPNSYSQTTSQTVYDAGGTQHTISTFYAKQNPATVYFYPTNGGTNPTAASIFTFNPTQDITSSGDTFAANTITGIGSGAGPSSQLSTTATPATGSSVTNEELTGVTLTAYPAGQTSTYQMTLQDGTQLMVTAENYNDGTNNYTRYAYAADRYATYVTVDGINVNRIIASSSTLSTGDTLNTAPNTTVGKISVGGAIAGSAGLGIYTIGKSDINNGLTGSFAQLPSNANLGGTAGTYTVPVVGGSGTGGMATITYNGSSITAISLSGGQNYADGDSISIAAGKLGSGSSAVTLGTISGTTNLFSGTLLTLNNGSGTPILSAQPVADQAAAGDQTFTFSNGITFTVSTAAGGDTAANIASSLNGLTVDVETEPVGYMAFVAGRNIDGLQTNQFGQPAYTTQMSVSTSVGSAARVNQLAITIDSSAMTAYSASQSTYANTQNGNPQAQLSSYTIDNAGILQATYSNGRTLMKGQLVIANFNNESGLIPVGNNAFEMSGVTGLQSGDAIFGTANSGNLGAIRDKAVESSNVDLTAELVRLMTLQRQYTANSQAVKVEAATIVDDAIRIGQ